MLTDGFFSFSERTGIVRSPLLTTLLQISSRLLLVWGIVHIFPDATSPSPFYSSMLIAWSISEIVRYSYFVFNLRRSRSISAGGGGGGGGSSYNTKEVPKEEEKEVPALLTWARYNFFYVLYPLGIGSEMALVWKASEVAREQSIWLQWGFWGVLVGYVPGEFHFVWFFWLLSRTPGGGLSFHCGGLCYEKRR